MKKLGLVAAAFMVLIIALFATCYQRIEAGYAGIRVNLYGSERGVDDVREVTGAVWYNPVTTKIYQTPLFVQNAIFTRDMTEGSRNNDEIRVTTNDGLVVSMDVSINYRVKEDQAVSIFKKYRKPLEEISRTILRNYIRDAYNRSANYYSAEEIYTKKNEFIYRADSLFTADLGREGFNIEKIVLLNELRLPDKIKQAIDRKIEAKQIAEQKKNELKQAEADAAKEIAKARGEAEALKVQADAERYAYEQKQRALTPLLIQQQFIEKWNGTLPVYGQTPQLFKDITGKGKR
ncbi:SPFH domain-containing protein [Algivirga pacifica]|uniref:Prohibitin family protein n=1 Tax=Algivirga pacifica TaxID=1162670 RepID=A0ABP9D8K4_9BACT